MHKFPSCYLAVESWTQSKAWFYPSTAKSGLTGDSSVGKILRHTVL